MFLVPLLLTATVAQQQRVAIIGGGFAGSSTAYFLTKLCPHCYETTIFEREGRVGGRVLHQNWPNSSLVVNAGGDAWSRTNTYLMELMKELDIQEPTYPGRDYKTTGLYKGPGQGWAPLANRKNDPHYIESTAVLEKQIGLVQLTLVANYDERGHSIDRGLTYKSVEEFAAFGGLKDFSKVTTREKLAGVDDIFINQTIIPASRDIYDQDAELNGFAGMAVFLSSQTAEHSCKGGNDQFVKKLIEKSNATVSLNTTIATVVLSSDNHFYLNGDMTRPFDRVVLAAPIEAANVEFKGFTLPGIKFRKYNHWYVIWLEAKRARPQAFDLPADAAVPDFTLTMSNSTARFVKLGAEYTLENGNIAYRFFSNYPIDDLDSRFEGLVWNKTFHWPYTFPDLTPTTEYQPVKLHERVYYPNALESMAVAMEVGVIGGRNAAMQIHRESQA